MLTDVIIDREFKGIIPPLKKDEYKNLEESIRAEGCRDPIILWNDCIVDGHNRYEICTRLHIPYKTEQISFASRDEAISWICLNQLSRRNLSEEAFRYLVGKRYDAEKRISQKKNAAGINQYTAKPKVTDQVEEIMPMEEESCLPTELSPNDRRTSVRLGQLYNLHHTTVERYGRFSRSLDEIERKVPGMLPVILSGSCKISKENIDTISQLPVEDVNALSQQIQSKLANKRCISLKESGKTIKSITESSSQDDHPILITGIKTMPAYDPDAKVNEVILTVPTWINELDSFVLDKAFDNVSQSAKERLIKILNDLENTISELVARIEGQNNGK